MKTFKSAMQAVKPAKVSQAGRHQEDTAAECPSLIITLI